MLMNNKIPVVLTVECYSVLRMDIHEGVRKHVYHALVGYEELEDRMLVQVVVPYSKDTKEEAMKFIHPDYKITELIYGEPLSDVMARKDLMKLPFFIYYAQKHFADRGREDIYAIINNDESGADIRMSLTGICQTGTAAETLLNKEYVQFMYKVLALNKKEQKPSEWVLAEKRKKQQEKKQKKEAKDNKE